VAAADQLIELATEQGNLDELRRLPYALCWLWMTVVVVLLLRRGTAGQRSGTCPGRCGHDRAGHRPGEHNRIAAVKESSHPR
jgi:hypothetical protein